MPLILAPQPVLTRHVATGDISLDEAARLAHQTTGQVIYVTRNKAPLTPAHLAAFDTYIRMGTARRMPAGLVYWTSHQPGTP